MAETNEPRVRGIHSRDDSFFLQQNRIGIGWKEMGNLANIPNDWETFKNTYAEVHPDAKKGNIGISAGMLFRFTYELRIDDYVIFPSKFDRKINIGIIESDYLYDETAVEYVNQRKVRWLKNQPQHVLLDPQLPMVTDTRR